MGSFSLKSGLIYPQADNFFGMHNPQNLDFFIPLQVLDLLHALCADAVAGILFGNEGFHGQLKKYFAYKQFYAFS